MPLSRTIFDPTFIVIVIAPCVNAPVFRLTVLPVAKEVFCESVTPVPPNELLIVTEPGDTNALGILLPVVWLATALLNT